MKILVDPHIHTVASGHAHSTVNECVQIASEKGLEAIAITDHAKPYPMDINRNISYFYSMSVLPRRVQDITLLRGAEVDIVDLDGTLCLPEECDTSLDLIIASVHTDIDSIARPWETVEQHTKAYCNVLRNPRVDILGHSGTPSFRYDIDTVLQTAKSEGKMIEINNNTFRVRPENIPICREIALRCKELGVYITIGSDAHICYGVGCFDNAIKMLEELDFPEHLIANLNIRRFAEILGRRKPKLIKELGF